MKKDRYNSSYVPVEKFNGSFFKMAVVSGNIYGMIFCLLFSIGCVYVSYFRYFDRYSWISLLSIIPFLLMIYMNYRHWKQRQKGKTS